MHSPQPSSMPRLRAQRPCRLRKSARLPTCAPACRVAAPCCTRTWPCRSAQCCVSARAPRVPTPTPQRLPARLAPQRLRPSGCQHTHSRPAPLPSDLSWPGWPCRDPVSRHSPEALLPQSRYKIFCIVTHCLPKPTACNTILSLQYSSSLSFKQHLSHDTLSVL